MFQYSMRMDLINGVSLSYSRRFKKLELYIWTQGQQIPYIPQVKPFKSNLIRMFHI